jgi:hypothetical protein
MNVLTENGEIHFYTKCRGEIEVDGKQQLSFTMYCK